LHYKSQKRGKREEREGGGTEIYFVEMLPKTLKLHFVSAGLG